MAWPFRKSEQKLAEEAEVRAEIDRLKALSVGEFAVLVLPGLGPDGPGPGHYLRSQQLCEYLLRDVPRPSQLQPLQLMARVNRALDKLEDAELVSSMAYQRSPVWRITSLGEATLADGTIEQRILKPA
jgi:hypothetical protein